MKNPIQYTSRTFNSVLADINADDQLRDKPDWWKRALAGIMDVMSMIMNAEANNAVLRTAFTRRAVSDLLQLIDYQLAPQSTSSGEILFYISPDASFPFSVASEDLSALSAASLAVSSRRFEARSSATISAVSESIAIGAVNPSTDIITVSRAFVTGEKIIITGTGLPTGLTADTEYWVIRVSDTEIRLASTIQNAYSGSYIDITAQGSNSVQLSLFSFKKVVYQQETKASRNIGKSDGSSPFQEFDLPELNILEDTLVITISGDNYARVSSLVDSDPTDKHYKVIHNSDNSSKVQFGNGTFGIIPPAFDIIAKYAVGGGGNSNIKTVNSINLYTGANPNISAVSNPSEITGGADAQSIEEAKVLGPLLLKTRNNFISESDGEALTLDYGGISQVRVNPNYFGILTVQILAISEGGGNLDTVTKAELQEYLISKTVLSSIDVRVQDIDFVPVNVTSAAKPKPGYLYADIEGYFDLAWRLFFSETGQEIKTRLSSDGISSAITLINTIFGTAFNDDDSDQIQAIVESLEPRLIGDTIQESDAFSYVDGSVFGIDYITISGPSFPITLTNQQITTDGTMTLSEIV